MLFDVQRVPRSRKSRSEPSINSEREGWTRWKMRQRRREALTPNRIRRTNLTVLSIAVMFSSSCLCNASDHQRGALCMSSGLTHVIDADNSPLDVRCNDLLTAYSKRAELFISCMLTSAKPLCFCEMCKQQYNHLNQAYHNITMRTEEADRIDCRTLLLQSDRIQAVERTRDFAYNLWTDSSCMSCYKKGGNLSDDALTFYELLNATKRCYANYLKVAELLSPATPINHTELSVSGWLWGLVQDSDMIVESNKSACTACFQKYNTLKSFYSSLVDRGNVCADLVDHMNITRSEWGEIFGCHEYHFSEEYSLIIGAMVFVIFLSFYGLNYLHYTVSTRPLVERLENKNEENTSRRDRTQN